METAKIFTNGGSQAVRLPKNCRFDTTEVLVNRVGGIVMLVPKDNRWQSMLASLDMFTDDFLSGDRESLALEERETIV